ncbi:MAG: ribbon-helix-helix protein, CopG family [Planctomycetes bacterium]|nr:ribbon-helix-helix protein, CopG family [Planctomycetota bacterium]
MDEKEYQRIQRLAKRARLSLGEFVRLALRKAAKLGSERSPQEKLTALRQAVKWEFPTGSIEEINAEIEKGYISGELKA